MPRPTPVDAHPSDLRFIPSIGKGATIVKQLCIFLIRSYQLLLSPLFPPNCRFRPTCSQYAIDAITMHGVGRGLWLSLRRLLRCHPFCQGGHDPVPPAVLASKQAATRNQPTT